MRPDTPQLENNFVRLESLAEMHRDGLRAAAAANPDIFAYMPSALITDAKFNGWFDWSLNHETEVVWAIIDNRTGGCVGSTRYLNVDMPNKRVEIGHTWYVKDVWGGPINPSCKYLLFQYGFEMLGLNRIELKTDARNARSRAAIAKLGAKEEGVFRRHMIVQNGCPF
jgi:RimJ/RimL family protein N-acetyltransferase